MTTATIPGRVIKPLAGSLRWRGWMTLLSSLSHGQGVDGTTQLIRTERVVQPDGAVIDLPIISGNSWRGQLRDATMRAMLRRLGDPPLSLPAFDLLFSGGSLQPGGAPQTDIDFARRLRETIPALAVFGGAVGNQIMRGKLSVGKLVPIVAETQHLVAHMPDGYRPPSIWDVLQEESYTRSDDKGHEQLRALVDPMALALHDGEQRERAAKKRAGETVEGHSQQMRYHAQTLAAGTLLSCELVLSDYSEVEFGALIDGLLEWARKPQIGGKGAIGHGQVKVEFADWQTLGPGADAGALAIPGESGYVAHVERRADDILELLGSIR